MLQKKKPKHPTSFSINNSDLFERVYICFTVTLPMMEHFCSDCLALYFITRLDTQANSCFFSPFLSLAVLYIFKIEYHSTE